MAAIHDEPVEVVRRGDTPAQFLLRDRLYVVRGILAHWVEPGGWRWTAPAWQQPEERAPVWRRPGSPGVGPPSVVAERVARPAVPRSPGAELADRELWRVEAAAGRSAPTGVYDLCRARQQPHWTVTRLEESEET